MVIVNLTGEPLQPVPDIGITVIVAIKGKLPVLIAVKEGMLPKPPAGRPIAGASLVQIKLPAMPLKLMGVVAALLINDWFTIGLTVGNASITPLTIMYRVVNPAVIAVILSIIVPAGAAADERT